MVDQLDDLQPIRFQGQQFDSETGLHYNRYRYYDPDGARYISQDPIGLMGGINPFNYVHANPLHGVDPDGLRFIRPGPRPGSGFNGRPLRWQSPRERARRNFERNMQRQREKRRKEAENSCSCDPFIPETWYTQRQSEHAPVQRPPYSMYYRFTPNGNIHQVTTYGKYGRRHMQYDMNDCRRPPHQHDFFNYGPGTPNGIRNPKHSPIE